MIVIVDYGLGNLASIKNMLKKIGSNSEISSDIDTINKASKLILPGVGAFDHGMGSVFERNLEEVLNFKALEEKVPLLGICLGMQLLTKRSEEGKLPGFGWIDAECMMFSFEKANGSRLKVPHMGWNEVAIKNDTTIFNNFKKNDIAFYFVHKYKVVCNDENNVLAYTDYGSPFASAIYKENIMGVQFHPEKSHKYGMRLFENFVKL